MSPVLLPWLRCTTQLMTILLGPCTKMDTQRKTPCKDVITQERIRTIALVLLNYNNKGLFVHQQHNAGKSQCVPKLIAITIMTSNPHPTSDSHLWPMTHALQTLRIIRKGMLFTVMLHIYSYTPDKHRNRQTHTHVHTTNSLYHLAT